MWISFESGWLTKGNLSVTTQSEEQIWLAVSRNTGEAVSCTSQCTIVHWTWHNRITRNTFRWNHVTQKTVSPKTDSTAHLCVSGSKLTAQEESCRWYTVGGAEGWRKDAHQVRPCWVAANVCLAHLREAQLRWVDVPRHQWHTRHRDLHPWTYEQVQCDVKIVSLFVSNWIGSRHSLPQTWIETSGTMVLTLLIWQRYVTTFPPSNHPVLRVCLNLIKYFVLQHKVLV